MDSNHRLYGFASRRIKPLCHQRLDITRQDFNLQTSSVTCTVAFGYVRIFNRLYSTYGKPIVKQLLEKN
jgi:hypothetical protein